MSRDETYIGNLEKEQKYLNEVSNRIKESEITLAIERGQMKIQEAWTHLLELKSKGLKNGLYVVKVEDKELMIFIDKILVNRDGVSPSGVKDMYRIAIGEPGKEGHLLADVAFDRSLTSQMWSGISDIPNNKNVLFSDGNYGNPPHKSERAFNYTNVSLLKNDFLTSEANLVVGALNVLELPKS